jgi:hypothetical protein
MRLLGLAAGLAALSLAACGGGGGSGSSSNDEAAISKIIHEASETNDPSKCSELATQRFLEQIQLVKGSKALAECRKDAKTDHPADSVDIANVNVDGSSAKGTYTQHGGDSDGQQLTVDFVKTGGKWRFDHIAGVKIDRAKFDKTMREGLSRPPNAVSPAVASCAVKELSRVSDTTIENAVVAAKPGVLVRPIAICAVANELRSLKVPDAQVTCAARRAIGALSDSEIEAAIADETKLQAGLERTLKRALVECGAAGKSSGSGSTS